jgi:hypothetical protein
LVLALLLVATSANADPIQRLSLRFDQLALTRPSLAIPLSLGTAEPLRSPTEARLAALLAQRPALEYSALDSSLTVSLEPGSPCTGACLKLIGWF